jgi:hypothetical protein
MVVTDEVADRRDVMHRFLGECERARTSCEDSLPECVDEPLDGVGVAGGLEAV